MKQLITIFLLAIASAIQAQTAYQSLDTRVTAIERVMIDTSKLKIDSLIDAKVNARIEAVKIQVVNDLAFNRLQIRRMDSVMSVNRAWWTAQLKPVQKQITDLQTAYKLKTDSLTQANVVLTEKIRISDSVSNQKVFDLSTFMVDRLNNLQEQLNAKTNAQQVTDMLNQLEFIKTETFKLKQ